MSCIKILIKNEYRKLQHVVRSKINKDCLIDLIKENIVDMLMLFNFHTLLKFLKDLRFLLRFP